MVALSTNTQRPILVIHPEAIQIRSLLQLHGYRTVEATDGVEAVDKVYHLMPAAVILGVALPDINGYQLCRVLKNDPVTQHIPVLLLSNEQHSAMDRFWSFKSGADALLAEDVLEDSLVPQLQMLTEIYEKVGPPKPLTVPEGPYNTRVRLNHILDKALLETTLMVEFRNLADLVHDPNLLNHMLFSLLENVVDYEVAAVFYHDLVNDPRLVTFAVHENTVFPSAGIEPLKEAFFQKLSFYNPQAREFDRLTAEVIGPLDASLPVDLPGTCYIQEFFVDKTPIGAFALYSREPVDFQQIFPVQLISKEIRMLMKLRHIYSHSQVLAITDGLTGLHNYRHFMTTLAREYKRAQRYDLDLSLAIIDIDHFKLLNDEWGHAAGDAVLKAVSEHLADSVRNIDFCARYGGEELVILLPETSLDNALIACQRFQARIAENPIVWDGCQLNVTVSVGLANVGPGMKTVSDLVRAADNALYEAKTKGRNRVELYFHSH